MRNSSVAATNPAAVAAEPDGRHGAKVESPAKNPCGASKLCSYRRSPVEAQRQNGCSFVGRRRGRGFYRGLMVGFARGRRPPHGPNPPTCSPGPPTSGTVRHCSQDAAGFVDASPPRSQPPLVVVVPTTSKARAGGGVGARSASGRDLSVGVPRPAIARGSTGRPPTCGRFHDEKAPLGRLRPGTRGRADERTPRMSTSREPRAACPRRASRNRAGVSLLGRTVPDVVRHTDETRPPVRQVPRLRPPHGRNPPTCSPGPPTSSATRTKPAHLFARSPDFVHGAIGRAVREARGGRAFMRPTM
jgi:hypothetical protein